MNIERFKGNLKFGGSRANNFMVTITNPVLGAADAQVPFMVEAASLPAFTMEANTLSYFGREIKLDGKRTYEDWQVTVINDEDFAIRNALETWMNALNSPEGNQNTLPTGSPIEYKAQATITEYSKTMEPLRTYKFVGLFPRELGEMEAAWSNTEIQKFSVTFAYDYFIVEGATGNAGGL
jgi:hypothetical protein